MTDGVPHSSPRFSRTTSSRRIGDNGVQKLATVLRDNRSLVALSLALNGIGPSGSKSLNWGLRTNKYMAHLNLGMNQIGNDGVKNLLNDWRNMTLRMLNLQENQITADGGVFIGEWLGKKESGIRELHLSFNDLGETGGKAVFAGMAQSLSPIHILSMSSCNIGNCMQSAALMMEHNNIISQLDLSNNNMGDDSCRLLCKGLEKNSGLLYLDIAMNNYSSLSGKFLANMLKHNSTLKLLDLSNNKLQDEGIKVIFNVLKDHNSLEKISILENDMTEDMIDFLTQMNEECAPLRIHSIFDEEIKLRCDDSYPAFTPFPPSITFA